MSIYIEITRYLSISGTNSASQAKFRVHSLVVQHHQIFGHQQQQYHYLGAAKRAEAKVVASDSVSNTSASVLDSVFC